MRAAAVRNAARSTSGNDSNARRMSAPVISSSAIDVACTPSNRAVYSTSAASPRARTSAMIAATVASTAASCPDSNDVSFASS